MGLGHLCVQWNEGNCDITKAHMLDPEHLRNFLHVVDAGSLSGASKRAHITQPALSRQMGLLEEEVGVLLFERTGRGMLPTLDGRRFEQRVRPLVKELDTLARDFSKAEIAGPLSVGVSPSIGMAWVARVVELFQKKYPKASLRLGVILSGAMGEAIISGTYDLGILYSPTGHRGLSTVLLWEEALFLLEKGRPERNSRNISVDEVLARPLILPSSRYGLRALLEREATARGIDLQPVLEVDSVQLALALVRQGLGQYVMTERAVRDVRPGSLLARRVGRPPLTRVAELASTEASLERPVVRAFSEFVIEMGG
jgi:LysR family nitrogen assimilation transcriptional regulator